MYITVPSINLLNYIANRGQSTDMTDGIYFYLNIVLFIYELSYLLVIIIRKFY